MSKNWLGTLGLLIVAALVCPGTVEASGWVGKTLVEGATRSGVAEQTIVLLLLLPLVATVVSVLHYVIGLSGYGIFMPTMIGMTFLATGIFGGLLLFGVILLVSILGNLALRKLRLHFWPSRTINLFMIGVAVFGLMAITANNKIINLSNISIFPVLFMILLAEEFVRTQLAKSRKEAVNLMVGTLVLAVIGAWGMSLRWLQGIVLTYPEIVVAVVLIVNLAVGNYTGIRWMEMKRFRKAIRSKK